MINRKDSLTFKMNGKNITLRGQRKERFEQLVQNTLANYKKPLEKHCADGKLDMEKLSLITREWEGILTIQEIICLTSQTNVWLDGDRDKKTNLFDAVKHIVDGGMADIELPTDESLIA